MKDDTVESPMESPPETVYTQAQAYAPMEALAAATAAALPDFPGFERRSWGEMPCSHDGIDIPGYTNIEIRYRFSLAHSGSELVREHYVQVLREHWGGLGYAFTEDSEDLDPDGRIDRNLAVTLKDGITLWYRVWGYVGLLVQSGPVTISDVDEFQYIPPTGGVTPGGIGDLVNRYFPDGIPTGPVVLPCEGDGLAVDPFDSPVTYDDQL
ncbi:hypothetical protein [Glycomyces buryatensis]|uniref:Uncharacterized protein n=1 Tax=Glycomyces buryatensis TaxID=2570927 RepID=A0A4S8QHJ0_9ACTN|nr:hypothetical protein [Glycomyces buryatensis]THV42425.1 hypothetical protein FAB82_07160 [Glycomyces buryatensis]